MNGRREMDGKLTSDRKAAALSIDGVFTGPEMESLIADLAAIRNQLDPEVSRDVPKDTGLGLNVSVQDDPDFQLRLLRDGRIRLWVRNRGVGWLVFNFPVTSACTIRDYLVANTPTEEHGARSRFFSEEDPNGDRSH